MHQLASLEWSDGFDTLMKQRNNEIVKKLTCHCGEVEIEILLVDIIQEYIDIL